MTHETCPWPNCNEALERNAVLCSRHHFRLPPKKAQELVRLKCKAGRLRDAELQRHLREQVCSYTNIAIRDARQTKNPQHPKQG